MIENMNRSYAIFIPTKTNSYIFSHKNGSYQSFYMLFVILFLTKYFYNKIHMDINNTFSLDINISKRNKTWKTFFQKGPTTKLMLREISIRLLFLQNRLRKYTLKVQMLIVIFKFFGCSMHVLSFDPQILHYRSFTIYNMHVGL